MQVSSRFTIAIHIFACIDTFQNKHKLTSEFIAGSVNVNPVVIRRILQKLKGANLVTVARGSGGVSLAKPMDEITLLDIFNAVESLDNNKLFHFHENPNSECPVGRNIHYGLDDKLEDIQNALEQSMKNITVADVVRDTQSYIAKENNEDK
jgi:Rrf2 family protein